MPISCTVPADISLRINELFADEADNSHVQQRVKELRKMPLNVGAHQLARAILILSENNREYFDKLITDFMGDPRDVIVLAEEKLGNPGHFCTVTFDKMKLK